MLGYLCLEMASLKQFKFREISTWNISKFLLSIRYHCVIIIIQLCDLSHQLYRKYNILISAALIRYLLRPCSCKHVKRISALFRVCVFPLYKHANFLEFLLLIIIVSRISLRILLTRFLIHLICFPKAGFVLKISTIRLIRPGVIFF